MNGKLQIGDLIEDLRTAVNDVEDSLGAVRETIALIEQELKDEEVID